MEHTGIGVSGQFEALRILVSERLSAITTEIVAAIAKTFIEYEAQAVRLKEENDRHRSLLDVLVNSGMQLKTRVSQVTNGTSGTSNAPSYKNSSATAKTSPANQRISPDLNGKFVFTSSDDFLAYGLNTANTECPYCVSPCPATKKHLMQRHYKEAAHFVLNGIGHFLVSCTCKERIKADRRSHFHCAFCHKIISRKVCFDNHILKKHGIKLVKNSKEAELSSSPFEPDHTPMEEQAPLSFDSWCQKAVSQENQQAVMFLQMNVEGQQNKNHGDQTLYDQMKACIGSSDASTQLDLETHIPEEKSPQSFLTSLRPKRRRPKSSSSTAVKLPPSSSANLRPSGSYQCKACSKTFHYMYTLQTHVQVHRLEGICGICGRRLGRSMSLLQHLQSHRRRKKCRVCGKQFSDDARLRRHSAFHRPKALSTVLALS